MALCSSRDALGIMPYIALPTETGTRRALEKQQGHGNLGRAEGRPRVSRGRNVLEEEISKGREGNKTREITEV